MSNILKIFHEYRDYELTAAAIANGDTCRSSTIDRRRYDVMIYFLL